MDQFEGLIINTGETTIFLRRLGNGPPVLLLHGFPESHLMWRDIAPHLANSFTVICADLRGYGQSGCPKSDAQHYPYSEREMAKDMAIVMEQLGFNEFFLAGHDRGGRVAYRLALYYPARVKKLAVFFVLNFKIGSGIPQLPSQFVTMNDFAGKKDQWWTFLS